MEKQAMVTVEFKSMQTFRCLLSEWKEMGGYKGFLKYLAVFAGEIKKVKHEQLSMSEYPTQEWAG